MLEKIMLKDMKTFTLKTVNISIKVILKEIKIRESTKLTVLLIYLRKLTLGMEERSIKNFNLRKIMDTKDKLLVFMDSYHVIILIVLGFIINQVKKVVKI